MDWSGELAKTFELPEHQLGVVVLGPSGEVRYRHAGPLDPAQRAALVAQRAALAKAS